MTTRQPLLHDVDHSFLVVNSTSRSLGALKRAWVPKTWLIAQWSLKQEPSKSK